MCLFSNILYTFSEMACSTLKAPKNGQVYIFDNGNTAIFVCNKNFDTVGSIQAYCVDEEWSSPPPTCQASLN